MPKLPTIAALAWMLGMIPIHADSVDFQTFNAKQSYTGVLLQQGRVQVDADWNEGSEGPIHQGEAFRIFSFDFDPAAVQPLVGTGIVSGLAVGAGPYGTLGGDQGLSLVVEPGLAINAFGAELAYGPFSDRVNADVFRLVVDCPNPPCNFAGNLADLDPHGGVLFLGVIAAPGSAFTKMTLEAVTPTGGFVPDWQIDGITFSPIPEPSTGALVAVMLCGLGLARRQACKRPASAKAGDVRMLNGNQHGCVASRSCSSSPAQSRL